MSGWRKLAARLSRGVVLRRSLPPEFRSLPIYVSPEAGLGLWRRRIENVDPVLFRLVRELVTPGAKVWDIGANLGLFAFSAAAISGPAGFVLAIEPDLWLAQLLTRSADRFRKPETQAAPVSVLCAAVAENSRITQLQIAQRSRAANSLIDAAGSPEAHGTRALQQTVTLSLDFLLDYFPAPSVLKIDVESAELSVLRGASRLLQKVRPVILCEVLPDNADAVTQVFKQNDYRMYPAQLELHERRLMPRAPVNTLAIPSEP